MPRPSGRSATKGRRRGDDDGDDVSGRWLTTYADAITLLMAFFVLLYAMSEIDVVKFTAFVQGLRVPFGNESGDGLLPQSDGLQPDVTPANPAQERPDDPEHHDESVLDNPPTNEELLEELEALRVLQREQQEEQDEDL